MGGIPSSKIYKAVAPSAPEIAARMILTSSSHHLILFSDDSIFAINLTKFVVYAKY